MGQQTRTDRQFTTDTYVVLLAGTVEHRRVRSRRVDGLDVQLAGRVLELKRVRRHVRHGVVLVRDVREVRDLSARARQPAFITPRCPQHHIRAHTARAGG